MNEPVAVVVRKAIAEYVGKPIDQILVTTQLDGLDLDSLDIVELSIDLEERLDIAILANDIEGWEHKKVSDVILSVDRLIKEQQKRV